MYQFVLRIQGQLKAKCARNNFQEWVQGPQLLLCASGDTKILERSKYPKLFPDYFPRSHLSCIRRQTKLHLQKSQYFQILGGHLNGDFSFYV